ncbi:MAG: type II toxin-antitoxin system PemK/MazF family toxin [Spirochaetales bacterium]|nr:type II toxin-antitoxin system PemK/MazF family toxin [Spirochaetales bacterium]
MNRGEIWWASLDEPRGSSPGFRRPVLVVQADAFNHSKIGTVLCAIITSNVRLADAPGNIFISSKDSGLPKDSVINISQIVTLNKEDLTDFVKKVRTVVMRDVENGIRIIFDIE